MKKINHYLFLILAFMTLEPLNAQVQKGLDLDGIAAGDNSGYSVSMPNSNTIAIGSPGTFPYLGGLGPGNGYVSIYEWNGNSWVQKGADIVNTDPNVYFGYSVSMPDDSTLAIGNFYNYGSGVDLNYVQIYQWNGSSWVQKGANIITPEFDNDNFGSNLFMADNNNIAIHAPGSGSFNGKVYMYEWNGTNWIQKGSSIDGQIWDVFGTSLSMPDANTIAIGAEVFYDPFYGGVLAPGYTAIYIWNGTNWIQKGTDIVGDANEDKFGGSVSMPDANTIAIGARENDGAGTNAGHVKIYTWDGSVWVQQGADIEGEAAGDNFGVSVSMPDVNTVAIGANKNDGNGTDAGQVKIYSWDGNSWTQIYTNINGEAAGDNSGSSIFMPDPYTVAIGASNNDGGGVDAGHVRIYTVGCSNTSSTITEVACDSYTSPSGNYTWTSSNIYMDTIPNSANCDSIITINLTINNVSDLTTTVAGTTINSNNTNASYQWLDCDNNNSVIASETGQSFTATANGNYAVELTENGCIDTTACVTITALGILENSFGNELLIYPNPTSGNFSINLGAIYESSKVSIIDISGQLINSKTINQSQILNLSITEPSGIYIISVQAGDKKAVIRLIKE